MNASVRAWLERALPWVVLTLYGLLKTHGMGASATDENIYFYMATRLAEGEWPYVDYFFAHPPLHVLVPGALFAITGFHLSLAKGLSALVGGITAWLLWRMARPRIGLWGALVAMVVWVFAAETLKATTNLTGINLTVMWLVLGAHLAFLARGSSSGAALGAALCTGVYGAAAACALLTLGWFRDRIFALRQSLAFLAVFGGINLAFWLVAGDAFLDGVYRYHGLKPFKDPEMWVLFGGEHSPVSALVHNVGVMSTGKEFTKDIFYHAHLWMGGLLAPVAGVVGYRLSGRMKGWLPFFDPRRWWDEAPHGWAAITWLIALAVFVEFAMFRELYSFYFCLVHPFLALSVGYTFHVSLTALAEGVRSDASGRRGIVVGLCLLVLYFGWVPWSARAMAIFPDELERAGQRNEYQWTPSPVLPALDGVVRTLFWKDHRLKGEPEPGFRHYLWNKKRVFATLPDIAQYIRANSVEDDTITGSSTSAPLVALVAERRLAAGVADTNTKRFKTGMLEESEFWDRVCQDRLKFVVGTPTSFFASRRLRRHPTIRRWFRPVKVFEDPSLKYGRTWPITLYERKGDVSDPCGWESP